MIQAVAAILMAIITHMVVAVKYERDNMGSKPSNANILIFSISNLLFSTGVGTLLYAVLTGRL